MFFTETDIYKKLWSTWKNILIDNNLFEDQVKITARPLSPEQALGNPKEKDYALLKGKESLTEAVFKGVAGQAYSSSVGSFHGSLSQVLKLPLHNSQEITIFIAALNATMRYLRLIPASEHCKNEQPQSCARELPVYLKNYCHLVHPKISLVGFQPRMAEVLEVNFPLRINDLDRENWGKKVGQVSVEGEASTSENLEWCDLALVTGTVLTNRTINMFMDKEKIIYYGTTIAGSSRLLKLSWFCPLST